MVDKEVQDLQKIGLTEGESKVYLALIEIGSSTVGPIVKKSKVAYSNVYEILQRLIEKGVVSYIIKNKTKYFQAVEPTNLLDFLEKKEEEISRQKSLLKKMLPVLEEKQSHKLQQDAEIFLGKRGLRSAYERLLANLEKGDEDLFFYIHEEQYAEESDLFYFSIQNILKKVQARGITNKFGVKSKFLKKAKYIKCKFVDFPIPGNIEVCGDKMLLISWKKPVIAILIHSQSISDNFKSYFNEVWKVAKLTK